MHNQFRVSAQLERDIECLSDIECSSDDNKPAVYSKPLSGFLVLSRRVVACMICDAEGCCRNLSDSVESERLQAESNYSGEMSDLIYIAPNSGTGRSSL